MTVIKTAILLIIKALLTGIGLGTGFFIAGFITSNGSYYWEAFMAGNWNKPYSDDTTVTYKERFYSEWFVAPFSGALKQVEEISKIVSPVTKNPSTDSEARSASEASASNNNPNNNPNNNSNPNNDKDKTNTPKDLKEMP